MGDTNHTEVEIKTEKPAAEAEETKTESCKRPHHACRPHTSLYLAAIALLIAIYATFTAGPAPQSNDAEVRIAQLEAQVATLNGQLAALGKEVDDNRANLIQNQLKKTLLDIQKVGAIATEETRAAITEIERILSELTAPATEQATPETAEGASATTVETSVAEESPVETPVVEEIAEPAVEELPATEPASEPEAPVEESVVDSTVTEPEVDATADPVPAPSADESEAAVPATETPAEEAQAF